MPNRSRTEHTASNDHVASAQAAVAAPLGEASQLLVASTVSMIHHFSQRLTQVMELQLQLMANLGQMQTELLHVLSAGVREQQAQRREVLHAHFWPERRKASVVINFPDRRARQPNAPIVAAS